MKHVASALALLSFLSLAASAADTGTGASFKGPIGLQLYSLRGIATQNPPKALAQTKDFGLTLVETAGTYNLPPEKFKALLAEHGLKPISGHFPYDRWKTEPEKVLAEAKATGLQYAGCAWITHKAPFSEAAARDAIATFNKAGELGAKLGIKVFYHAHGFEFHPHAGGTLMDLLIAETNPKHVSFQMDVLWVVFPGQDPVQWLKKYPGRWELMHLKDLKKGVKTGDLSGKTDVTNDVPLGTGQMNWPAILKAAKESGVKYYFIEDESPTVVEQVPQTLKYLGQVKF
ncbi:MAG: Xylose isomerase domain protein TIM barrel [Limisphaerales bacterium]|nr:MAG: Xylose isomerase domain protein TIM barrel [Limisphaerales bacterium]KAG0507217.1 MAG: Xylose isomerase domain protein TIM barrel [Limisphaerales bacterium]TXT47461.1 MAG: Xylose isomerase domain protein TIM barrel [Limisphaerales bacterium]